MSVSILSLGISHILPSIMVIFSSGFLITISFVLASEVFSCLINKKGFSGILSEVVIQPATADAATTSGDARYILPFPCLPEKFLFPVLIVISPGPFCPTCPAAQPAHPAFETRAPAFLKISISPSFRHCFQISSVAGTIFRITPGATFLFLRISAAFLISFILPFVQLPMNAESIFTPETSDTFTVL